MTVAIGGGIGAMLRYLIANPGQSMTLSEFPLGTLIVNIFGCALIGFVMALLFDPLTHHSELLRLFLIVGILGGFTTFSIFALDTFELFEDGRVRQAISYVVLSNAIGILVACGFHRVGTVFFQPTPI